MDQPTKEQILSLAVEMARVKIREPKPNDPSRPGQQVTVASMFGPRLRFALVAIHTRFDKVDWIVQDAETADPLGFSPAFIAGGETGDEALGNFFRLACEGKVDLS